MGGSFLGEGGPFMLPLPLSGVPSALARPPAVNISNNIQRSGVEGGRDREWDILGRRSDPPPTPS